MSADVDIETMIFRERTLTAQVPLPGKKSFIPTGPHCFGERLIIRGQPGAIVGWQHAVVPIPSGPGRRTDPIGDADARRVLPQHDTRPGGAADLAGRVSLGEAHPARGELVDMRRFVEGAPLDADILHSQVIHQKEENVKRPGLQLDDEQEEQPQVDRSEQQTHQRIKSDFSPGVKPGILFKKQAFTRLTNARFFD